MLANYSAKAVEDLQALGVDPYVAPEQTRHGRVPPPRGRIPRQLSPRDRMRRKLHTKRGRQRYSLRMATVEPVFGQIKEGRGFRQFLLRGLEKVNGEWSLICHRPQPAQTIPLRSTGPRMSMGHAANRARWDVSRTGWERRPMHRASQSEHQQQQ